MRVARFAKCLCRGDSQRHLYHLEILLDLYHVLSVCPQAVQIEDIAKVGLELSLSSCDLQTCTHMTTILFRDVLALAFDGRCSSAFQPFFQLCHWRKVGELEKMTRQYSYQSISLGASDY